MEIHEYIFRNKKTIGKFAEEVGVSRTYLSAIMHGKYVPSKRLAKSISLATHGAVSIKEAWHPKVPVAGKDLLDVQVS